MLRQRLRPGDEDGDPEDAEEGKPKKPSAGNKKGVYYTVKIFMSSYLGDVGFESQSEDRLYSCFSQQSSVLYL